MIEGAKELGVPKCFVQFFSDGRDTRPTSGGMLDGNHHVGFVTRTTFADFMLEKT